MAPATPTRSKPLAESVSRPLDADFSRFRYYEFGGPVGGIALILFSHFIVYYLWIVVTFHGGVLIYPRSVDDVGPFFGRLMAHVYQGAMPTVTTASWYLGFITLQALLTVSLPGIKVSGLPVPALANRRLEYICNGVSGWYVTLALAALLHCSGLVPLTFLVDNQGPLLSVAVIFSDLLALYVFLEAKLCGTEHRASGNIIYDFFMGINLNPRIGRLDIKMLCEIRISWIMLFLLTCSAAVKQYETLGFVPASAAFMVVAHFLYANACQKGEECIPTTWDVFYENFGWFLAFWNCAGVAFTYSFQSIFLSRHSPVLHAPVYTVLCFALLFGAYWVWDTANSQKNRFRMMIEGTYVKRQTFPQLPWGTLHNPDYLTTRAGSKLLVDGWYRYARKIHYTADTFMALSWGLICGFSHFLPYFYFVFFLGMITHRYLRDRKRMQEKYGDDFDVYAKRVPYVFIPGLF